MFILLAGWPLGLKVLFYIAIALVAAGAAYIFIMGLQIFNYATRRQDKNREVSRAGASQAVLDRVEAMKKKYGRLFSLPHDKMTMNRGGLVLTASYFPAREKAEGGSRPCALVVHGWRDSDIARSGAALAYLEAGYSVLMPALRGHGDSGGKRIDLGCQHYRDLFFWMEEVRKKDRPDFFILDGLSMGASTVIMAAGDDDLPSDVLAVLADCGYTSLEAQGRWATRGMTSLPGKLAKGVSLLFFRLVMGYKLSDPNPLSQIAQATCPIFIIHGTVDRFVPTFMGEELYQAASPDMKELWLVEGAEHAMSEWVAGPLYWERKLSFIEKARAAKG